MAETPAALDIALEATTAADARVPSAAADIEIIDVGSASSTDDVGLSGGALGQSLSPVTEQTAVGHGCSRTFSKPSPGACLCVFPCFFFTFALLVLLAFAAVGIPCFVLWLFSGYF